MSIRCNPFTVIIAAACMLLLSVQPLFAEDSTASIVIKARAVGGEATFSFTGDLGDFEITSDNDFAERTFEGLAPGSYQVTQHSATQGWSLVALMCHDPAAQPDFDNARIVFELAAGASPSCTFVNRDDF